MTGNRLERGQQKRPFKRANTQSLLATKAQSPSKAFPKSLLVLEMMKLGKVVDEQSTERIELFKFDVADMAWSSQPFMAEFSIASEPFGKGGFREAFKATSKMPTFQIQQWVVKRYLKSGILRKRKITCNYMGKPSHTIKYTWDKSRDGQVRRNKLQLKSTLMGNSQSM